jgi:hypothetical protein
MGMCAWGGPVRQRRRPYAPHHIWADLFAKDPPLSPIQMEVERQPLQTATLGFWARQAQANGISDIATLKAKFEAARPDLAHMFNSEPSP